ncbi:hypothetical protein B5X24_HaOG200999 [Helicoverpa armigera]|nr:hypothetical protein B5X24_HaOG200999 [Helicoverpa armigera]
MLHIVRKLQTAIKKVKCASSYMNTDNLAVNVIEKYLQATLLPLNIMQELFFCAKYQIQNDFIYTNGLKYDIVSAIGTILYVSLSFYLISSSFNKIHNLLLDLVVFAIGSILNYFVNIMQKNNNVLLICSIQNAHRMLDINGMVFKRSLIFNWIYVIALNSFHIFWLFYYCYTFDDISIRDIFTSYLHICFDVNVVYAAKLLEINRKTAQIWIERIQQSVGNIVHCDSNNLFKAYLEILKSYQLIEKTFQYLVSLFVACN